MRIKVIAIIGGTKHPVHGRLAKGKEFEIDVEQFGNEIFKPKRKEDEKAIKKHLASLKKTEEVAAAPLEEKKEEVTE